MALKTKYNATPLLGEWEKESSTLGRLTEKTGEGQL